MRTAFSISDRIQEMSSGLKEEWEDIVVEAHFKHLSNNINKDIADMKNEDDLKQLTEKLSEITIMLKERVNFSITLRTKKKRGCCHLAKIFRKVF